jgi:hypothetical protein
LLIGGCLLLRGWTTYPAVTPATVWAILFFLATVAVNLSFALMREDLSYLPAVFFMVFNAATFLFTLGIYYTEPRSFTRATGNAIATSLALQAALSIILGRVSQSRAHLFFNNPNQLGYFALIGTTLLVVCARRVPLARGAKPVGMTAGLYLAALSLSKAALIGYTILALLEWSQLTRRVKARWVLAAAVAVIALTVSGAMNRWLILSNVSARLQSVGVSSDDNLTARGYGRMVNYPQYLAFGAGDGEPSRWVLGQAKELHSSWGTILFAYGVLGFTLFVGLLVATARTTESTTFLYLFPLFFYGLTHQGLREPLFWVTLAMVLLSAESIKAMTVDRT